MYKEYKDRAEFLFVYIKEAHPDNEWQMESNRRNSIVFNQPTTLKKRAEVAKKCSLALKLTMPCVVDDMKNTADNLYAGWPERLFVVDTKGRIALAGSQGPFGFEPDDVRKWLDENLRPSK